MKKTWSCLCLAALLTLPLAGCAGRRTGSLAGDMDANPSPSHAIESTMPNVSDGWDDLAGSDGIVGGAGGDNNATGIHNGTDVNGAGNTGNDNVVGDLGRMGTSAVEGVGEGIKDTLDDLGSAARRMGRDARDAIEG